MNKLVIMVCGILTIQSIWSPAIAAPYAMASVTPNSTDGTVSGKASLKAIGPLHISEGMVIMKDNAITVLSDAADPIKEAELSGVLLHVHAGDDGSNHPVEGIALFTRGYSIAALDLSENDSVKTNDGVTYGGHISHTSADWLRMETNSGVKLIPIKSITEIVSPRAFKFSIVPNVAPTQMAAAPNQMSFNPTYIASAANVPIALHASTVHKQLAERHLKRRLLTTAAVMAAFAACVAIPMGIATATRPPSAFTNNNN